MPKEKSLVLTAESDVTETSKVNVLLSQIRPEWRAKNLIQRVEKLLDVDPSSACQRLFNAAIHDLRQKIVVAGLDIAKEASKQHKLPPITKAEDVEDYPVMRIIDLAYRIGLLSRPQWRRILRAYDIRKDLEHEDDEYEAGFEDCVYIFKTCIEVVLANDPIELLRLTDIKHVVEDDSPGTLTDDVVEDFGHAPESRQTEIYRFLVNTSLNGKTPDVIRQNCYKALYQLRPHVRNNVRISLGSVIADRIGRREPSLSQMLVANASGILPYLKKRQLRSYFGGYFEKMRKTGYRWTNHSSHGDLLRSLEELGGLDHCPDELMDDYLEWLVLCYIGEPGGYGTMGHNRRVFYSNKGAPICLRLLSGTETDIYDRVVELPNHSTRIKSACGNEYVARRFENILDEVAS